MTRSADDLIYEAAAILGKAVPGEALGAIEYDKLSQQVDSTLAMISKIVYLDRDQIPDELFTAVADLVAGCAAPHFSMTAADPDAIEKLEKRISYLVAPGRTIRTLRVDPAVRPYRRNVYAGYR